MLKVYIGIDPGKTGAISVIDKDLNVIISRSCPTIKDQFDRFEMVKVLENLLLSDSYLVQHAVLEDIHSTHVSGRTGSFTMGEGKGIWEGILPALGIRHSLIQPKEWQKEAWLGVKKVMVNSSSGKTQVCDTKATSLLAVKNLFPKYPLTCPTQPRATKPHDGIVDSLLIAYYSTKL